MASDDLLDFFDLSKKWEPRKDIMQSQDEEPKPSPWDDVEADGREEEEEAEAAAMISSGGIPTYAVQYREREEAIYRSAPLSREPGSSMYSGLSAIDANTIIGSDAASVAEQPPVSSHLSRYFQTRPVDPRGRRLPIFREKDEIICKIDAYPVTVIAGPTGCGKTTQVPQFILEHCRMENKEVNIIVTQPRRLAAQSVAKRVCQENGWPLGSLVGYKVGLDKENCSKDTRLLYCTTGMLKKMVINKKSLTTWTHVIIDEIHEREMDMDFLLMLCKRLLNTNSTGVKLILMSATVNVCEFTDYFNRSSPHPGFAIAHEIDDTWPMHRIDLFYLDSLRKGVEDQVRVWPDIDQMNDQPALHEGCVEVALGLLKKFPEIEERAHMNRQAEYGEDVDGGLPQMGAVLVFLPGEREIARVKSVFEAAMRKEGYKWKILPLHSRMPFQDMQAVFGNEKGYRKVILSTNIAESSITIPDICYVIDFCLTKKIKANRETNYVSLQLEWTDQQSCKQRRGRAGRVRDGRVFRLVPLDFYNNCIPKEGTPEMMRAPLDKVLLDTKLLDFGSPKELLALAMCPPELKSIKQNMMILKESGCLFPTVDGEAVEDDGDLGVLGELVAALPVDIRFGKLVVLGYILGVPEESVIIAAGLSNNSVFATPFGKKMFAYNDKLYWADKSFSDCLAILYAYQTFVKKKKELPRQSSREMIERWARSCHLQLKSLEDVSKTVDEIYEGLKRYGVQPIHTPNRFDRPVRIRGGLVMSSESDYLMLKFAIFGAFYPNYFLRGHNNRDHRDILREVNGHDPLTSMFVQVKNFPSRQRDCLPLYEDQIKGLFKDQGIDAETISVDFDGSKAVIDFERNTLNGTVVSEVEKLNTTSVDESHEIDHKVFVGMKLRGLPREALRLQAFTDATASRMMKQLEDIKTKSAAKLATYEAIGQREPPAVKHCRREIMYVASPNSFWVASGDDAENIMNDIEAAFEKHPLTGVRDISELRLKGLCLARFRGNYYRARVDKIENGQVSVFFIDYGNADTIIDFREIIKMNRDDFPRLVSLPGQALECSLKNVRPNPLVSPTGSWDDHAVKEFENALQGYKLQDTDDVCLEIYSVIPRRKSSPLVVVSVLHESGMASGSENLVQTLNEKYLSMARKGIKFAAYEEESYLSETDHARRTNPRFNLDRSVTLSAEEKPTGIPMQLAEEMSQLLANKKERIVHMNISGPFHPLEFKLSAVHRVGSFMPTTVEPDSVNSVLLDRYHSDLHDIWAVAAQVGMNSSGSSLILRATTFMPNSPGLGSMLAMIFAPRVELRCDCDLSSYTGSIVGLGDRQKYWGKRQDVQSSERVPYYADHDMELKFDVEIDNEDIININEIRRLISQALSRDLHGREDLPLSRKITEFPAKIVQRDAVIDIRDKLVKSFRALIHEKRRGSRAKVQFGYEFNWDVMPKIDMVKLEDSEDHIFKPINRVPFGPSDSDILGKLELMWDVSKKECVNPSILKRVTCPLCRRGNFQSIKEIQEHIEADLDHKDRLKRFTDRFEGISPKRK